MEGRGVRKASAPCTGAVSLPPSPRLGRWSCVPLPSRKPQAHLASSWMPHQCTGRGKGEGERQQECARLETKLHQVWCFITAC